MRFFLPVLASVALLSFFQPPSSAFAAENWSILETKNPPDAVTLKISRPSSWKPNVMDSDNEISRGFFHFVEKPFHLQRGVLVTGTVYGKAEGASEDISKYSKQELESFAKIVVNNATKISNPISKNLRSYEIIKINGLNALKILFDKSARVNNGILFSISEIIVTFYDQNFIGERAFSSIVLLCSYTGFANDKDLIIKSFNNQHDEICQRFYSSLEILDKWK